MTEGDVLADGGEFGEAAAVAEEAERQGEEGEADANPDDGTDDDADSKPTPDPTMANNRNLSRASTAVAAEMAYERNRLWLLGTLTREECQTKFFGVITASGNDIHQPPPSQFPLTTEQLERLYKLLESPTPFCSIATKGNSAFLSVSLSHTWIVDSGAFDHMTGGSTLFSSVYVQDLNSGKMIGNAKESGGLYYVNIRSASQLS
ncbi:hypothetical protein KIW84_073353 [Lathyrus oleraceus]|uniref:Uncharacterized protein n=1 Tax=Pisum sativum TaxID=3888 RepID=A0A9D4VQZ3_PEA|nr:hypothetical protein KIW84_073353 [Pisum sativum]